MPAGKLFGVPAVSAASSGAHSLSALGFQSPPHVPLPPPDLSGCVGGLDLPPELISVLSPLPQSYISPHSCSLLSLSPRCAFPIPGGCRGCSEQPFPALGRGRDGAAEHEIPVRDSLGGGLECSELCLCPGAWVGEGSERFPCVEFHVLPWGARPGAGSTLSNNLEPLPSMFYP